MKKNVFICLFVIFSIMVRAQIKSSKWLEAELRTHASALLLKILNEPQRFRYQIIYTQINRDRNNKPQFIHQYFNVNDDSYFYPASMVKMPTALAALEKINSLKTKGIDKYTTMLTDSSHSSQSAVTIDSSAETSLPSINHYLKKIFLVSDNDAYNRLYEFCGQQFLNQKLWEKGYTNMRITRRFVQMTPEENRFTNGIRFIKNGKTVYTQAPEESGLTFNNNKKILLGKAHLNSKDELVNEPYDFTTHNKATLTDLQQILQSVLFPESVDERQRFLLTEDDYSKLYQYMSEKPSESRFPKYDTANFFDSYTKFFFFRDGKQKIPDYIRSFNKTGWSHGFLTDVCYIVDFKNNIEFMLSGCIYVNDDEILNDNRYEYEQNGYPFFKEIGEIIYKHELKRKRRYSPNLSKWKLVYD